MDGDTRHQELPNPYVGEADWNSSDWWLRENIEGLVPDIVRSLHLPETWATACCGKGDTEGRFYPALPAR
jgi:hypothetical protein